MSLEHACADDVVRLDRRGGRRCRREVVAEDGVDDDIPRLGLMKAPPERRFLMEAELAWDPPAPLVRGVRADLDAVDVADVEGDPRQRGWRLRRGPLAGGARLVPVPDLERVVADPPVQPGTAD